MIGLRADNDRHRRVGGRIEEVRPAPRAEPGDLRGRIGLLDRFRVLDRAVPQFVVAERLRANVAMRLVPEHRFVVEAQ